MTGPETLIVVTIFALLCLLASTEALFFCLLREPTTPLGNGPLRRWTRSPGFVVSGLQVAELAASFALAWLVMSTTSRTLPLWLAGCSVGGVLAGALAVAEVLRGIFLRSLRAAPGSSRTAATILWPATVLATLCRPLGRLVEAVAARCAPRLPIREDSERGSKPAVPPREIRRLLERASEHGALAWDESRILLNLVAFGTEPVTSFMTPRTEILALDVEWPVERVRSTIQRAHHRRYPVIAGDFDHVLGCVVAKELCLDEAKGLEAHLRPLPFVPESKVAGDVFQEMRAAGNHMALVIDEYGSVEGMVTLNGLVASLMGELPDEFTAERRQLLRIGPDRHVVDGALPVAQLNAELGLDLPLEPDVTVGGLVFSLIGHLPQPGEQVAKHGARVRVLNVRRHRIASVELEVIK